MELVALTSIAFAGLGCTRNRNIFSKEPPPAPFAADAAAAPPQCQDTVRCSRDLKRVLRQHCDGTEDVVAECGPDLGCGDGACVEACKSAELSKGSIGCSFATLPPDNITDGTEGSCFAAIIANVWDRPVAVHATLSAASIDISQSTYYAELNDGAVEYTHVDDAIAPGKLAIIFLAQAARGGGQYFVPCPGTVIPALREDPIHHGTARTRAFHLTTDAPVSAYSIWPYGGARSYQPAATLLLPISAWDNNYVAVSSWASPTLSGFGWPVIQIVATENDTEVLMRPNVDIVQGSGVLGVGRGGVQTWMLARGEVLQIKQMGDTSGSPIEASKPVGLFGGSECTKIPFDKGACDATQQQIPPVSRWGSEYALVPYRPRIALLKETGRESLPWRFVGAADGTTLTYEPAPPAGAPETLEAGQVVTFMSSELVTVHSQDEDHPFYVAMFMTGTDGQLIGDPDFVNVVPSAQFLDRYVFFLDHTYPDTTLTFVRRKMTTGFHSVTLECAGEVTNWQPLGSQGEYEFAWVYVTKGGLLQRFTSGICGYGRHEVHSDGPFIVYAWGMGPFTSYGYAGGQGSRPLNNVKLPSRDPR